MEEDYLFVLPSYSEKIVKVVMVDENRRSQHCNDCNNYCMYKCKVELDYCLNCGSKDIEINF